MNQFKPLRVSSFDVMKVIMGQIPDNGRAIPLNTPNPMFTTLHQRQ